MIVISSREFRENQKKFLDLAETQRVVVKRRGGKYTELVNCGDSIPENPSPSNDPYFDDPRNLQALLRAMQQVKEGNVTRVANVEELNAFLDRL